MSPQLKRKNYKPVLLTGIICLLVIVLVVLIVTGIHQTTRQSEPANSPVSNRVAAESTDPFMHGASTVRKKHGQYYIVDPDEDLKNPDGVWSYSLCIEKAIIPSISPKPNLYYFEEDHFSKNANGLYLYNGDDKYYYMKNGVWDSHFNGLVSMNNYLRVVKNGVYQNHMNGTLVWTDDNSKSEIRNGAVYGSELGRPDGWIYPNPSYRIEAD